MMKGIHYTQGLNTTINKMACRIKKLIYIVGHKNNEITLTERI